jgi:hypothetical protein
MQGRRPDNSPLSRPLISNGRLPADSCKNNFGFWDTVTLTPALSHPMGYLFSGSGCRAATTPPRAAAERLARTARLPGSHCAAGRGATRRSATSSTTLNRYPMGEGESSSVGRPIQPFWKLRGTGLAVPSPVGRVRVRASALSSAERVRVVLLEAHLLSCSCCHANP